ncbi:MAG: YggS family pyridoxal phosphate-dependent enzyme [Sphingobium sp.]|nr:MAG: YggS family pyridoxal phosphate-dependent enzyme [Sphingobium sp.]
MTTDIPEAAARLATLRDQIDRAARLTQRSADDINLIAVSKTQPAEWPALREQFSDLTLHLVGQLQSNKAADAVALFDVIHSLDRLSLLTALAKAMDAAGKRLPCFIQVNIGAEEQKGGCPIADVPALIAAARDADIPLLGLMCVPPADVEPAPYFALLAKMAREEGLPRLSMGMSGDFETALMLGATDIRVGTALFGERAPVSRPVPRSGLGMIRNAPAR